jgi:hypothetical protein
LQPYLNRTLRLRFNTYSFWGSAPAADLALDKVTLAEMPAAVMLETLTPHLRSVDVAWSQSTLGSAFHRYEVYQATRANVTPTDTLIGTFTNLTDLTMTATGLTIGGTYYYRVFTVDTNDTYIPSNERSTTTVPVNLPLTDDFATDDQWVSTGTWGVNPNGGPDAGPCLTDSPTGDYVNSSDSYALTAVNLTGTTWPVLRFTDRHRLAHSDWGWLEISSDGGTWTRIYGVAGLRTNWIAQAIDLSPWKGQANLRLRFHLLTDGGSTEDGWLIDNLSVTDQPVTTVALPVQENFENTLTNWLTAGWLADTNLPFAGSASARTLPGQLLPPETQHWLTFGSEIVLSNLVNPQLTFWLRGQLPSYARFRLQLSTDAGLTWADQSTVNLEYGTVLGWTRLQTSLQPYLNRTLRLRFNTYSFWGSAPAADLALDKVTLEETPASVTVNPIDQVTVSSLHLSWTEATIPNFKEYRVYRSESPTVTESSTLLAVITNKAELEFVDTGLMARKTYYYRVYLYNSNDTGVGSNQASTMTLGVPMGWADSFETNQPCWTFTGTWQPQVNAGRNSSIGLVDSPGDYANSSDTSAQVAVNLSETTWPVLKFWDRHTLANSDFGWVAISSDAGGSWTQIYGISGVRTNWAEQSIDLSPWKNQAQVWIRFRLATDGGTQNDGWYVDDVSIGEKPAGLAAAYPFMEHFESGLTNWIATGWTPAMNAAHDGAFGVRGPACPQITPETSLWLGLNQELVLTNAVNPQLSFWLRGQLASYSRLRVQVSINGGVAWVDLVPLNQDTGFSSEWVRRQVSLQDYTNRTVRLRFVVYSYWGAAPASEILIDQIGLGEPAPGAPTLVAPAQSDTVADVRPVLVAGNAIEYQSDPLTYRFEVYADASLSNLVAQVPAVAAGLNTTAWQVDVNLNNNAQYWWRCRATDGTNEGPWMATATFYVNELNNPPLPVILVAPNNGAILSNLNEVLVWYPTSDPDVGDTIRFYQLQVAADPGFTAPLINATNLVVDEPPGGFLWAAALELNQLAGAEDFTFGTRYFWRMRAQDSRYGWSAWSEGTHFFRFGLLPPMMVAKLPDPKGPIQFEWPETDREVFVEFTPTLSPPQWSILEGPIYGTNWSVTPVPGTPSGFYRLRVE